MDTMEAIRGRKSYRGNFKAEPIPRKDLKELIEAGFLAPSGCNMQTTRFIGVDDSSMVSQLADICGCGWAKSAPAAILLLTKYTLAPSGESYHIQDFSAAAQNILLAAEAMGYATTWIEGQIRGEKGSRMKAVLGVPEEYEVAIYMPIGIPVDPVRRPKKQSFEDRAWFNGYQT